MAILKHDILLNAKTLLISLSVITGMIVIGYVINIIRMTHSNDFVLPEEVHYIVYMVFLMILGIILSGMAFPGLRTKEKAQVYLTLPASNLEKFLSMLLLTTVGITAGFTLVFWVITSVIFQISELTTQIWFFSFSVNDPVYWKYSGIYIMCQSAFLLGAVSIKRLPILRTISFIFAGVLVLFAIGFLTFIVVYGTVPWKDNAYFNYINMSPELEYFFAITFPKIMKVTFWYVMGPLFWITAFLRLTEKEV